MKSVFAGAAVLAALVPLAASAQGGDVVVQQRDAGTLGADGFARAVAKSTNLSVDLPCTYVELSFTDSKNESGSAQYANAGTIILCTRFGERQTFGIVLRTGYNNGAMGADHFFAQQITDDRKVGTVEEKSFKGNRAFTSLINDGTACKWKIGVRKGDELVTVSYITPISKCEADKAAAMRVLNSLELG